MGTHRKRGPGPHMQPIARLSCSPFQVVTNIQLVVITTVAVQMRSIDPQAISLDLVTPLTFTSPPVLGVAIWAIRMRVVLAATAHQRAGMTFAAPTVAPAF